MRSKPQLEKILAVLMGIDMPIVITMLTGVDMPIETTPLGAWKTR